MAQFNFSGYFVFMFLSIALLTIFGGLGAALLVDYDVETSESFDNYISTFDADVYADKNTLEVDKSNSGSGEFSEYESSFKFGDQVKQTTNQTDQFVEATTEVLGLPSIVWYIISGIIFILMLVLIIYFLRGISENK